MENIKGCLDQSPAAKWSWKDQMKGHHLELSQNVCSRIIIKCLYIKGVREGQGELHGNKASILSWPCLANRLNICAESLVS